MADIKPQVYKDERPPETFMRFHERTRSGSQGWTYELVRMITTFICLIFYRDRAIGTENVPASGPVVLAPNHFSNLDHFLAGVYLRRKLHFMAKSQLFGNPVLDYIFTHGGVFPVMRGRQDEEAFKTAHAILARGDALLMYAEAGRSRTGDLNDPRPGIGKIALESGVPIIPVAIHGSKEIRQFRRGKFPKVTVQYGEPMSFPVVENPTREQQLEAANKIFDPVREMYRTLDEQGRAAVIKARRAATA